MHFDHLINKMKVLWDYNGISNTRTPRFGVKHSIRWGKRVKYSIYILKSLKK